MSSTLSPITTPSDAAVVSTIGVGSGLDLNGLMTSLQNAESVGLTNINNQQASYTATLTSYGLLSGALSGVQTAAAALGKPSLYTNVSATSSLTGVLTATADSTAVSGTYSVNVTQMAQAQTVATTGVASTTTAIGNGTVTIQFGTTSGGTLNAATGTYSGATFTADTTQVAASLTINSSNNTLAGISSAINANKALGVSASIISDGSSSPNRLVLTALATGQTSSMQISVTGDTALSNLLSNDTSSTQNLQQTSAAQNAQLTVNGIAVTSTTNTVAQAMQGVTMTLAGTGSTSVAVQTDTSGVTTAINNFVTAYNSLHSTEASLTAYNSTTGAAAGSLIGSSTLSNIESQITSAFNIPQNGGSGSLTTLAQLGVTFQADGTLAVNSTKLASALSTNLSGVASLFSSASGTTGFGSQMSALITGFSSTSGLLTDATSSANDSYTALGKQYTVMQNQINTTMANYQKQFTNLDVLINKLNSTSTYLTQQFAPATTTA
ncbi:flagellar filament capping protein FliD [Glaciimonas sp. PAMC28666]|uniref:flagellar filament capping protein FliD n=1 Tax=Glaciimonas sp. PAMC28666 TaxID=2807626 RepID=UPI001963C8CF|nr:flagellar filament capping protein FliD [Glaciimonas sp. PAMC28666]QRX83156.1 flagellar filament capping protein FliD [Glaciimonas sp. PAMC28666]